MMHGPMFPLRRRAAAQPKPWARPLLPGKTPLRGAEDEVTVDGMAKPLTAMRVYQEFYADVQVAKRAEQYVLALGAQTPKCIRSGWNTARFDLIERGEKLRNYFSTSFSGVSGNDMLLASVDALIVEAEALIKTKGWDTDEPYTVEAPELGEGWEKVDTDIFFAPLAALGGDSPWWNQRFWAYFALMPVAYAAGVGYGIYFAGGFLFEVASDYGLLASATVDINPPILEHFAQWHKKWHQHELRSMWKQLHVAHVIAETTDDPVERLELLKTLDPRLDPFQPGLLWDGTMPSAADDGEELPVAPARRKEKESAALGFALLGVATVVVLAAVTA